MGRGKEERKRSLRITTPFGKVIENNLKMEIN